MYLHSRQLFNAGCEIFLNLRRRIIMYSLLKYQMNLPWQALPTDIGDIFFLNLRRLIPERQLWTILFLIIHSVHHSLSLPICLYLSHALSFSFITSLTTITLSPSLSLLSVSVYSSFLFILSRSVTHVLSSFLSRSQTLYHYLAHSLPLTISHPLSLPPPL